MTHDPLCEWGECTCPLDYDVPERGHLITCPAEDCECEFIAKVRADTLVKCVTAVKPLLLNVPETKVDQAYNEGVLRSIRALRGLRRKSSYAR